MDTNYLKYGKKYPALIRSNSERCGCQDSTGFVQSQNHFEAKIGVINQGMAAIVADMVGISSNWEEAIKHNSKIEVCFSSVELRTENGTYFLLATDNRNNDKAIVELVEDNGGLYEAKRGGGGLSVQCSGCEQGCDPKRMSDGNWVCTPCGGGGSGCTKTVTVSFRAILGGR